MVLRFGMLRTVNLGNYENIKVEFSIEMEVDKEQFEAAKDTITNEVENHINNVIAKYIPDKSEEAPKNKGGTSFVNWD